MAHGRVVWRGSLLGFAGSPQPTTAQIAQIRSKFVGWGDAGTPTAFRIRGGGTCMCYMARFVVGVRGLTPTYNGSGDHPLAQHAVAARAGRTLRGQLRLAVFAVDTLARTGVDGAEQSRATARMKLA